MYYKSKKVSLLILLLSAIICATVVTYLFDDPINKTLLSALSAVIYIYVLSLIVYLFDPSTSPADITNPSKSWWDETGIGILQHFSLVTFTGLKRLLFVIFVQIIIAVGILFYYWN